MLLKQDQLRLLFAAWFSHVTQEYVAQTYMCVLIVDLQELLMNKLKLPH